MANSSNFIPDQGLSSDEAAGRLSVYGPNSLKAKKSKTFIRMFIEQFRSFMIFILVLAAVISAIVGYQSGEGLLDAYIIAGILLLNALMGAYQEKKAQTSLESLRKLSAPVAKVIRDGVLTIIPAVEIVPGDLVEIEAGDIVPADIHLTAVHNLQVQEASLTGESVPVDKDTTDDYMAFSSSIVTYGRGRGVVTATGMDTEIGKIAKMLEDNDEDRTPMKIRLEKLGKVLGIASIAICVVIFIIGIIYGRPVLGMFLVAVSLAVAAIPEGLPAISTIVLSIGVQRMVKRRAIVRTLPSVETLGSTTVICSDKTGTLTQNKMTVTKIFSLDGSEKELATIAVLCNDSHIMEDGGYAGDPTETALTVYGDRLDLHKPELDSIYPRVSEIPFDSDRKRMSVINRSQDGTLIVNVKGGLDEILSICDGLTKEQIHTIQTENRRMAESALRVLAFASKQIDHISTEMDDVESHLVFAGMVGMIDPPREEVIKAVAECKSAGIRPIMITGDHQMTALAIGKAIGIYKEGDLSLTGAELKTIDDESFKHKVEHISVYARVAPEQKVRIVKAWQDRGEIVAMTGDGVNDAPALKQADIGVSMGITGTEVAKDASDMILTDDNFATIVSAVEEGRRVYDNLLKTIQFLLSTNIGVVLLLFIASMFDLGIALLPIHILWINLVSESFPALGLSMDPPESDLMNRKPQKATNSFMGRKMMYTLFYQGVMIGLIPLAAFIIGVKMGGEPLGQTMAFTSLIAAKLVHVGNLHSLTHSRFIFNPFRNKALILAVIFSAALTLAVLLVPDFRDAFKFVVMDGHQWLIILALALVPMFVVEIVKASSKR